MLFLLVMYLLRVVIDGHPITYHTPYPNEVGGVPWVWGGGSWTITNLLISMSIVCSINNKIILEDGREGGKEFCYVMVEY